MQWIESVVLVTTRTMVVAVFASVFLGLAWSSDALRWPPETIGVNVPSVDGLAPLAYLSSACDSTTSFCYVFGGMSPSRVPSSETYQALSYPLRFVTGNPENSGSDSSGSTFADASQYAFRRATPTSSPSARSAAALAMVTSPSTNESFPVLFGGALGTSEPLGDFYVYSRKQEVWLPLQIPSTLSLQVPPMAFHSLVSLGPQLLYVFFGVSSTSGITNRVYRVDVDVDQLQVTSFAEVSLSGNHSGSSNSGGNGGASRAVPQGRFGACCASSASRQMTVCYGGVNGLAPLQDTWVFDHNAAQWHEVQPLPNSTTPNPAPRFNPLCAHRKFTKDNASLSRDGGTEALGGQGDQQAEEEESLLVFGGFEGADRSPIFDSLLYEFSFSLLSWRVLANLSEVPLRAAGGMHCTNEGRSLELFGGQGFLGTGSSVYVNTSSGMEVVNVGVLGDRWLVALPSPTPPPRLRTQPEEAAISTINGTRPLEMETTRIQPEARVLPSAAQIAQGMLVSFGYSDAMLFDDAFYCDGITEVSPRCLWRQLTITSSTVPAPRFGASAAVKGNTAYFFGGFTALDRSVLSNELWALHVDFTTLTSTTLSGSWYLVPSITSEFGSSFLGATPLVTAPPRALHTAAVLENRNLLVVVGGVVNAASQYSNSVHAFDLAQQVWYPCTVIPPMAPRAGHVMHYNGTHAFVMGGFARSLVGNVEEVLSDVVLLSPLPLPYTLAQVTIGVLGPRALSAAAGAGNNVMVCGGALFYSSQVVLGNPLAFQCVMASLRDETTATSFWAYPMTKTNANGDVVEGTGFGGVAVQMGALFVYFGGSVVVDQVERLGGFSAATNLFNLTFNRSLCTLEQVQAAAAAGSFSELQCFLCGRGSRNPSASLEPYVNDCIFAQPGFYIASYGFMNETPCAAGRFSSSFGASSVDACELCPVGTYSSTPGSSTCLPCPGGPTACPLGSTSAAPSLQYPNSSAVELQPAIMPDGQTPILIYVIAAIVVACMLVSLGVVTILAHHAKKTRRAYFLDDDALALTRAVYLKHRLSHFGLDAQKLGNALSDLGVERLPADYVARLLVENDDGGVGHVTCSGFQEIVISFIERGLLRPFPNTGEARQPGRALTGLRRKLAQFSFKNIDSYETEHALGVEGDAMHIRTTVSGGVTRVLFLIFAVGVALALIGQFVYTNVTEVRASQPSVSFAAPLTTESLLLTLAAIGGTTEWQQCSSATTGPGLCTAGSQLLTVSSTALVYADFELNSCEFVPEERACVIRFGMKNVSLAFGQDFSFLFGFGEQLLAYAINVSVEVASGIAQGRSLSPQDLSVNTITLSANSVVDGLTNPSLSGSGGGGGVFRGYPASVFAFDLLPTQFVTVNNLVQQSSVNQTGFHVLNGFATAGNVVGSAQVSQYFGVPVAITFQVGSSVLTVSRLPSSTVLDFISQMLGSITGMGGLLVTLMQMYDSRTVSKKYDKLQEELEDALLAGDAVRAGSELGVELLPLKSPTTSSSGTGP